MERGDQIVDEEALRIARTLRHEYGFNPGQRVSHLSGVASRVFLRRMGNQPIKDKREHWRACLAVPANNTVLTCCVFATVETVAVSKRWALRFGRNRELSFRIRIENARFGPSQGVSNGRAIANVLFEVLALVPFVLALGNASHPWRYVVRVHAPLCQRR